MNILAESHPNPTFIWLWRRPVALLGFGFGSGLFPWIPGTAGTAVGLALFPLLALLPLDLYLLAVALAAVLGIYICGYAAHRLGVHDHPGIVFDEFVGLWIALALVPREWPWLLAGFFLFRAIDMIKPWPISWCDRSVHGGIGIMLDDVLAGVASLGLLAVAEAWI